jgi:hypothetical protein
MEWEDADPSKLGASGFALTVWLYFGTVLSFLKHQSEMFE